MKQKSERLTSLLILHSVIEKLSSSLSFHSTSSAEEALLSLRNAPLNPVPALHCLMRGLWWYRHRDQRGLD